MWNDSQINNTDTNTNANKAANIDYSDWYWLISQLHPSP